ncbi:hypothetical protein EYS14_20635 [Alteromonadaceae bacterium M269]|nr:hypothetical protein EYS14_20635 [Alteromonadaceae bacterium M269]
MANIKKPREYRDKLCWVILKSKDRWKVGYKPNEEQYTVGTIFQELIDSLPATKRQMNDLSKHPLIIEMLKLSREAFRESFHPKYNMPYISNLFFKKKKHLLEKKAIYILQEVMGIIWSSYKIPEKYVFEAQQILNTHRQINS